MQGKKTSAISQKIATGAQLFLVGFAVFVAGFNVAQRDSVKRTMGSLHSGELQAEMLPYAREAYDKHLTVKTELPDALQKGAILIGSQFGLDPSILLVDGQGTVLHRWHMEGKVFNTEMLNWWRDYSLEKGFSVDDAHLLPGGDVIFIQLATDLNSYRGQRLARMDKDSHIIWQVTGNFHHFLDITGDRIYALSSALAESLPEIAPPLRNVRYLDDYVEAYTLDGKQTGKWSITQAFARSPYHTWLSSFEIERADVQRIQTSDGRTLYDLFHPNSVQCLSEKQAKAIPQARAGDILLSFKELSAIAVLRPETGEIVWAAKGPWKHQHNVQVLADGKLYMYDNQGKQVVVADADEIAAEEKQSRVLCYDPFGNRIEEIFAERDYFSAFLGDYDPLPDGSWVISYSMPGRVIVASPEKKIVWQLRTIPDMQRATVPYRKILSFMHYYPDSALAFLQSGQEKKP